MQNLFVVSLVSKNIKMVYRTVIPPVLYGHEAWSFTMREEYRLSMHKNRVLRMIFGPNRDLVLGVEKTT